MILRRLLAFPKENRKRFKLFHAPKRSAHTFPLFDFASRRACLVICRHETEQREGLGRSIGVSLTPRTLTLKISGAGISMFFFSFSSRCLNFCLSSLIKKLSEQFRRSSLASEHFGPASSKYTCHALRMSMLTLTAVCAY